MRTFSLVKISEIYFRISPLYSFIILIFDSLTFICSFSFAGLVPSHFLTNFCGFFKRWAPLWGSRIPAHRNPLVWYGTNFIVTDTHLSLEELSTRIYQNRRLDFAIKGKTLLGLNTIYSHDNITGTNDLLPLIHRILFLGMSVPEHNQKLQLGANPPCIKSISRDRCIYQPYRISVQSELNLTFHYFSIQWCDFLHRKSHISHIVN